MVVLRITLGGPNPRHGDMVRASVTNSEAIRRLVELGLTVKARPRQVPHARAERARELAAKVIDKLTPDADTEEKVSRKYRLLKGPEEFREARVDRANKR